MKLKAVHSSHKKEKKFDAVFEYQDGHTKTIPFGARGMSDFTKHKDPERKKRYIARHRKRENWKDPTTAGALSLYVLWNKPSFRASVTDYKRRFKL